MNPGGLRADLIADRDDDDHLPGGRRRAAVRQHAGHDGPHRGADQGRCSSSSGSRPGRSRPFLKLGVSKGSTTPTTRRLRRDRASRDVFLNGGRRADGELPGGRELVPRLRWRQLLRARAGNEQGRLRQGRPRVDGRLLRGEPSPLSPDHAQRAVGVKVAGHGDVCAGRAVTVTLSSLLFSNTEPAAGTVAVVARRRPARHRGGRSDLTPTRRDGGDGVELTVLRPRGPTRFDITVTSTARELVRASTWLANHQYRQRVSLEGVGAESRPVVTVDGLRVGRRRVTIHEGAQVRTTVEELEARCRSRMRLVTLDGCRWIAESRGPRRSYRIRRVCPAARR